VLPRESDDYERIVAEVPSELKALVDTGRRDNREIVEAALWAEFGGQKKSALKARLENKQSERKEIEKTLSDDKQHLEAVDQEIERLKRQIDAAENTANAKEEAIEEILAEMENHGRHVWADSSTVNRIAENHFNGDAEAAFTEIREAAEAYSISNTQFTNPSDH